MCRTSASRRGKGSGCDGEGEPVLASLKGVLQRKADQSVLVEVAGLGFLVHMPASSMQKLTDVGSTVQLHTYLYVRENGLALYGFLTEAELHLFQTLLGVSGIGPKGALALLSRLSVPELIQAIAQGQPDILSQVPGVGLKTARKVILELRDKVARQASEVSVSPELARADAEVQAALVSLGYSVVEAQRALQALPADVVDVGERLRMALQQLGS